MSDTLSRRELLFGMAVLGISATAFDCQASRKSSPKPTINQPLTAFKQDSRRPNILLIVTDQERFNIPRPAGYSLPGHERLQSKGTTFRKYNVATAPCTPSRAVIMTGQHVPLNKMFDNINFPYVKDFSPALPTVGGMMRAAGYYTAYKGKWHLSRSAGSEMEGTQHPGLENILQPVGFADFNPSGDFHGAALSGFHHDGEIAASAADWLLNRGKGMRGKQPWFLTVGFVNPHDIMFADNDGEEGKVQDPQGPFKGSPIPADPFYQKQWDPELPMTLTEDLSSKPKSHADWRRMMTLAFGDMPLDRPDLYKTNLNYYLNCIRDVDRHLVTVLDALEASGQADNTIIIYTADHGELAGSHGLRQKGPMIYHENVNVPMIIVHPDVKGGSTSDALFSAVDLAPTLLGLGSIEDARQRTEFPVLKGYDLSEAVANPGKPGRRDTEVGGLLYTYDSLNSVDVEFMSHVDVFLREGAKSLTLTIPPNLKPNFRENRGFLRGVYDGRYKLARYFAPAKCNRPKTLEDLFHDNDVELYDTQTDPEEVNNLAADREKNSAKLIELNAKLELLIESEIGKDREVHFPDLKELRPMPFQR